MIYFVYYFNAQFKNQNEDVLSTTNLIIACVEVSVILYQCFCVVYRFITKRENFYYSMYGDAAYDETVKNEKYYTLKPQDGCTCPFLRMFHRILSFWCIIFPASVIGFFSTLGIFYLFLNPVNLFDRERIRKIVLDQKRYTYWYDYFQNHVVLHIFKIDRILQYFIQNEPFKDVLNDAVIVIFQNKYFWRIADNSLPNYNLLNDKSISYESFVNHGKTTYSRWLPAMTQTEQDNLRLPAVEDVVKTLFHRDEFIEESNMRLNLLAISYIRYFVHQFTNTKDTNWNEWYVQIEKRFLLSIHVTYTVINRLV